MPEWIASGALKNVEQFSIDVHMQTRRKTAVRELIQIFRDVYSLGFRLISWVPNLHQHAFLPYCFEVTFVKNTTNICRELNLLWEKRKGAKWNCYITCHKYTLNAKWNCCGLFGKGLLLPCNNKWMPCLGHEAGAKDWMSSGDNSIQSKIGRKL